MAIEKLVEGWTQRLTFQLKKGVLTNDIWVFAPIPREEIEGTTVTLVLRDKSGAVVDTVGDTGWLSLDASVVYYDPDAADLVAAKTPHTAHWKIHDVSGKDIYIPKGVGDDWLVSPQ